jgi:Ca2+-binding EF-hand superfamily protein
MCDAGPCAGADATVVHLVLIVLVLQHVDTDGDGYISQEELTRALSGDIDDAKQLSDAVREALQDADKNKDGRIDYMVSDKVAKTKLSRRQV